MTSDAFDVLGIGNAIVDVISRADEAFLGQHGLVKGSMMLIDEAMEAVRREARSAVRTRSEKGSIVVKGGETHAVPAAAVAKVVDTTGAGDLYAAGFLFGYTHGKPLAECARLGGLAAAEIISHVGARPEQALRGLV